MNNYQIVFTRSARKELEALKDPILNRVFRKIEALAKNPKPKGCRKLKGQNNLWRVHVGDYRIYAIDEEQKIVDSIIRRHRSDAYK